MDVPLQGNTTDVGDEDVVYETISGDPVERAEQFLKKNKTAKIVIVLDTHCAENGAFVWTGTSPATYRSCFMLEVS